ncbi:MAG: hypothetical protein U9N55_08510, partial [candidate division Zixibacteria bacterium]|nr:hypothetical protein [candidate division Zixibacteria bacterium]
AFPGYYHLRVAKEIAEKLRNHGVNVIFTDVIRHSHEKRPSEGSEPEGKLAPQKKEYSKDATQSRELIFNETFSSSTWEDRWYAIDFWYQNGYDYWGDYGYSEYHSAC